MKRLLAGLLLAGLLIAIFPAAAPVSAATAISVTPASAPPGATVRFTGTVAFIGNRYELYWDSISPANLLTSGSTLTSAVSAEFTVPETARGPHGVFMQDIDDRTQSRVCLSVIGDQLFLHSAAARSSAPLVPPFL